METTTMGCVTTQATIENLEDLWDVRRGQKSDADVRRVNLADALVDTGATFLSLPSRYIKQLGIVKRGEKPVNTSAGPRRASIYDAVRLTIQGRDCTVDVAEVPDTVPPLVGQIPLEALDFVVDPIRQRLIGNPEHGGEHVIDMY